MSSIAARATIGMSARSSRAVSVMNTLFASESAQAMIERARAMPACMQHHVIGRVALDEADAEPLRAVAVAVVGVHDHVAGARRAQVALDLAADAAEAADDVVVGERVDHLLHAPGRQQVAEVPGDEELGDRGERVEERTDAQHDQQNLDDLPGGGVRLWKATDGRSGVERPAEAVPEAHALGERQADRTEEQQPRDSQAEQRDAPHEQRQLAMRRRAGAFGHAVQQAIEVRHECRSYTAPTDDLRARLASARIMVSIATAPTTGRLQSNAQLEDAQSRDRHGHARRRRRGDRHCRRLRRDHQLDARQNESHPHRRHSSAPKSATPTDGPLPEHGIGLAARPAAPTTGPPPGSGRRPPAEIAASPARHARAVCDGRAGGVVSRARGLRVGRHRNGGSGKVATDSRNSAATSGGGAGSASATTGSQGTAATSATLVAIGAGLQGPAGLHASVYAKGPQTTAAFAFDPQGRLWLAAAGLETHAEDGVYMIAKAGRPGAQGRLRARRSAGPRWYRGRLYVASVGRVDAYGGFDGRRFTEHTEILHGPVAGGENNLLAMAPTVAS